jgi:hypothetical protein
VTASEQQIFPSPIPSFPSFNTLPFTIPVLSPAPLIASMGSGGPAVTITGDLSHRRCQPGLTPAVCGGSDFSAGTLEGLASDVEQPLPTRGSFGARHSTNPGEVSCVHWGNPLAHGPHYPCKRECCSAVTVVRSHMRCSFALSENPNITSSFRLWFAATSTPPADYLQELLFCDEDSR